MIRKDNRKLTIMLIFLLVIIFLSTAALTTLIISQTSGFYVFGSKNNDLSLHYDCKNHYLYKKHRLETNFRLRRNFAFTLLTGLAALISLTIFIDIVYGLRIVRKEYSGLVEEDETEAFKEYKKQFYIPTHFHKVILYITLAVSTTFQTIPCLHYL
jgi:hypothetical protein